MGTFLMKRLRSKKCAMSGCTGESVGHLRFSDPTEIFYLCADHIMDVALMRFDFISFTADPIKGSEDPTRE